jgi:hypothetical protein
LTLQTFFFLFWHLNLVFSPKWHFSSFWALTVLNMNMKRLLCPFCSTHLFLFICPQIAPLIFFLHAPDQTSRHPLVAPPPTCRWTPRLPTLRRSSLPPTRRRACRPIAAPLPVDSLMATGMGRRHVCIARRLQSPSPRPSPCIRERKRLCPFLIKGYFGPANK